MNTIKNAFTILLLSTSFQIAAQSSVEVLLTCRNGNAETIRLALLKSDYNFLIRGNNRLRDQKYEYFADRRTDRVRVVERDFVDGYSSIYLCESTN
jgi:hypothetical protein